MLGWSIMFIYQFDADYAKDLYANYKRHFSRNFGVLRLFKERHNVSTTDIGDIDSGPILAGFSIPANEFALGNAVLAEDYKTARKLQRLIRLGTSSIKEENEFRYEPRLIDFTISPMAEALVLYSSTITQWTKYN
ncbi:MAG: hypothetical protein ED557_01535 [Balneola sp.]|nr:MAG: hypothetical protein ED557_01535 [Balneola sp.]